ncbi:MAG: protein-L-isoaspartate O-methyltransferase family protein [Chloroflexota bacterium]
MSVSEELRTRLVDELVTKGALTDERIKQAFLAVPREQFLPETAEKEGLERVYQDAAIQTLFDSKGMSISSSSQPAIMAPMLEMLQIEPGMRVLEIGTATGYNAALLSHLVGPDGTVVSIELQPTLTESAERKLHHTGNNMTVCCGDGREGVPDHGPCDKIIVTASAPDIYRPWFDQLRPGGLLVLPLVLCPSIDGASWFGAQAVVAMERIEQGFRSARVIQGHFMGLRAQPSDGSWAGSIDFIGLSQARNGAISPMAQIRGNNLRRLSDPVRIRLARLVATAPRRAALRGPLPHAVYCSLAAPQPRLLGYSGAGTNGIAVFDSSGRSLRAMVAAGPPPNFRHALLGWGEADATASLQEIIATWKLLGSPGLSDLQIRVSYGRPPRGAWRLSRRQHATLAFDWPRSA